MNIELLVLGMALLSGAVSVLGNVVIQYFNRGKTAAEAQKILAEIEVKRTEVVMQLMAEFTSATASFSEVNRQSNEMLEYLRIALNKSDEKIDELERKLRETELSFAEFRNDTKAKLDSRDAQIDDLEVQLANVCHEKDDQIRQLELELDRLRIDMNKFVQANIEKDKQIKQLQKDIAKLQAEFDNVKAERDALKIEVDNLRNRLEERITQEQKAINGKEGQESVPELAPETKQGD